MSKRGGSVLFVLALGVLARPALTAQETRPPTSQGERAKIGQPIKSFKLRDLMHEPKEGEKKDADIIDLADYKGKKSILLCFISENCTVSRLYEPRIGALIKQFADKDITVFGVRCTAKDTPDSYRKWLKTIHFDISALDDERAELVRYFKVICTTTFVLIDKQGVYRYFGSLDDAPEVQVVRKHYLADAVTAALEEKEVPVKETRPFG